MTAIIKSADAAMTAAVRPIPPADMAAASAVPRGDDREERLEACIAELEERIAALTREAEDLRAEAAAALARGEEKGREMGKRDAEDRERERLDLLEKGILAGRKELAEALGATERLAALLARDCLDKLFADASANADRVCALLRAQMVQIEQHELLAVVVSAADFSEEGLERLRTVVPDRAVELRRDADLPAGSCKLRARLGEIDIGLGTQWQAVGDLLADMALAELPPC
jgi:flagellar biosynthesis/type III secretory pathway protein FliH